MALSANGQARAFSALQCGFESRWGHHMKQDWIYIEAYDSSRTKQHAKQFCKKLERRLASWRREIKAGTIKVKALKNE